MPVAPITSPGMIRVPYLPGKELPPAGKVHFPLGNMLPTGAQQVALLRPQRLEHRDGKEQTTCCPLPASLVTGQIASETFHC